MLTPPTQNKRAGSFRIFAPKLFPLFLHVITFFRVRSTECHIQILCSLEHQSLAKSACPQLRTAHVFIQDMKSLTTCFFSLKVVELPRPRSRPSLCVTGKTRTLPRFRLLLTEFRPHICQLCRSMVSRAKMCWSCWFTFRCTALILVVGDKVARLIVLSIGGDVVTEHNVSRNFFSKNYKMLANLRARFCAESRKRRAESAVLINIHPHNNKILKPCASPRRYVFTLVIFAFSTNPFRRSPVFSLPPG